jgi:type II secretory ATPase GspE/PulE/Tfp pilus assembly ATPase PilB-like protein
MDSTQRTRSPHVKLQEFLDCYLQSDFKEELEHFSEPHLTGSIREEIPDEALRYFALVLLYAIEERVQDISFVRKAPDSAVCRMIGDNFYEVPAPREEIISALFEEIEEMTGMDTTRRKGKLILGLKDSEIDLEILSTISNEKEEKILIHLPPFA